MEPSDSKIQRMIEMKEQTSPEGINYNKNSDRIISEDGHAKFVFPDDIWIITFPKSGTTWTQEIVWCLVNKLDLEGAKVDLDERVPFFECSSLWSDTLYSKIFKLTNPDKSKPPKNIDTFVDVERLKRPRLIKSHLHYSFLPEEIYSVKPKIIYVSRNPKDVCVSFYHHSSLIDGYTGSLDDFVSSFVTDNVLYSPYWTHLMQYWELRGQSNISFLQYEDMKKDLKQAIQQIADFLQIRITKEEIQSLTTHVSFENMKNNPAVNKDGMVDCMKCLHGKEYCTKFIRSGIIGSGIKELSPKSLCKMDKWIEENKFSDSFPYLD